MGAPFHEGASCPRTRQMVDAFLHNGHENASLGGRVLMSVVPARYPLP